HLVRAERADILGFGDAVARVHRDAAMRCNRRARQQLGYVIERIDARRQSDDWAAMVKDAQVAFREHNGQERLDDAREDLRIRLLEADPGSSAAVSDQVLELFNQSVRRAGDGNLDLVLDLLRENAQFAYDGFAAEQMGRQPAAQARALFASGP